MTLELNGIKIISVENNLIIFRSGQVMARKYSKYQIKITYTNGDTEDIKLGGIAKGSYKEMLQVYQQVKNQYANKECKIDFVGIGSAGEIGILFTKEVKIEKPWFQKEAEEYTGATMSELIQRLHDTINLIERRGNWIQSEFDLQNKMQDIFLHRIETFDDSLGDDEKNYIFENLKSIRINRRLLKEDMKTYEEYKQNFKADKMSLRKILANRKQYESIKHVYLTDKLLKDKKILTTAHYNTIEEKLAIIDKLKKKYEKITFNDAKRQVVAYNKAN